MKAVVFTEYGSLDHLCLIDLKELIEAGKIVPSIYRVYALTEVAQALRYFKEGRHIGKIAIAIAS